QTQATVTFEVAEAGPVRVEVLDVLGRRVAVLKDAIVAAGEHTARGGAGALPSGPHPGRPSTGDAVQTERPTLGREPAVPPARGGRAPSSRTGARTRSSRPTR